jgi:hypothetical protein
MLDDFKIRNAFQKQFKLENKSKLIEELDLNLGKARVDLIQFGDFVTGYEIKSDKDTLSRLKTQSAIYNHSLEKIVLITGEKLIASALETTPPWWGITLARFRNNKIQFKKIRNAKLNPFFDPTSLLDLLWKDELIGILKNYKVPGTLKNKTKYELKSKLATIAPYAELKLQATFALKSRKPHKAVPQQISNVG